MLPASETHRSFAALRMTGLRFVVILSIAKDLYIAAFNRIAWISTGFCEAPSFPHGMMPPMPVPSA